MSSNRGRSGGKRERLRSRCGRSYHSLAMLAESVKLPRMVAMILAGGRVGELSVLTLRRPKSALPFGGYFRVIDFALSNLSRAGINNVGIL